MNLSTTHSDGGPILDEYTLGSGIIWIGIIPFPYYFYFGVDWAGTVGGTLSGTVTGGFTYNKTTTYWASYDHYRSDRFKSGKDVSGPGFEKVPLTATLEGALNARLEVIPYFELAVGPDVGVAGAEVRAQAGVGGNLTAYGDFSLELNNTAFTVSTGGGSAGNVSGYSLEACLSTGMDWSIYAFYLVELDAPSPFNGLDYSSGKKTETLITGSLIDPVTKCWYINGMDEPTVGSAKDYFSPEDLEPYIPAGKEVDKRLAWPSTDSIELQSEIVIPEVIVKNGSGETVETFTGGYTRQWQKDGVSIPGMNTDTLSIKDPGTTSSSSSGTYSSIVKGADGSVFGGPATAAFVIPDGAPLETPVGPDPAQILPSTGPVPEPIGTVGTWNGTDALFLPVPGGGIEIFDGVTGSLVETLVTGFPAIGQVDFGSIGGSDVLVVASEDPGNDSLRIYGTDGVLLSSYTALGNITAISLSNDFLVLANTTGSGTSATTNCRILDMTAADPFLSPLLLGMPTGGGGGTTVFPGLLSIDTSYPYVLVGVPNEGKAHLYNIATARSPLLRATAIETFGDGSGAPLLMGARVRFTGKHALIRGTGVKHQLYSLLDGSLLQDWNAPPGTRYYPTAIDDYLIGLGNNGVCSLLDKRDLSIMGTYTITALSGGSTSQNLISNEAGNLGLGRFTDGSGPVTAALFLFMLLEEMDTPGCF